MGEPQHSCLSALWGSVALIHGPEMTKTWPRSTGADNDLSREGRKAPVATSHSFFRQGLVNLCSVGFSHGAQKMTAE